MNLEGRTAIVTGAAVRIGRAIALGLADAGCNVAVHYGRSAEEADAVVSEIVGRGGRAVAVQADLLEPDSAAESIVERTVRALGPPSILVNSAAIFEEATLADLTSDHWDRHLTINLKAPTFLCREFARHVGAGDRGHIVNIVDQRVFHPPFGHLAYTVSKCGLAALTKLLAVELAPDVQVNAVAPGAILPGPGQDQSHLKRMAAGIPLRRTGDAGEIVNAVLYLLRSDFVTGEILAVAGGEQL